MNFEEDVFRFHCKSGNVETTTVVTDVFTDKIVEAFVDFLRGCGHFDSCIYEHMRHMSDQYFEMEEKKTDALRPLPPEVE